MAHEVTDPALACVSLTVSADHLLQFGAMLGESSADLALWQRGGAPPVGPQPSCLFGVTDCPERWAAGWERMVEEHLPGLHYWAYRRQLRNGLYLYKSHAVYERCR